MNNNKKISLLQIDSESELRDNIYQKQGILLGSEIENTRRYYMTEMNLYNDNLSIGILSGGHGIDPQIKIIDSRLIITSDQMLYIFSVNQKTTTKVIECDSLIFDLIVHTNDKSVIVICELDIKCITYEGDTKWSWQSDDTIIDYEINHDVINIVTEAEQQHICLENGKLF